MAPSRRRHGPSLWAGLHSTELAQVAGHDGWKSDPRRSRTDRCPAVWSVNPIAYSVKRACVVMVPLLCHRYGHMAWPRHYADATVESHRFYVMPPPYGPIKAMFWRRRPCHNEGEMMLRGAAVGCGYDEVRAARRLFYLYLSYRSASARHPLTTPAATGPYQNNLLSIR